MIYMYLTALVTGHYSVQCLAGATCHVSFRYFFNAKRGNIIRYFTKKQRLEESP